MSGWDPIGLTPSLSQQEVGRDREQKCGWEFPKGRGKSINIFPQPPKEPLNRESEGRQVISGCSRVCK